MAARKESVKCYLYDLSQGMARQMSLPLLGKQIDGIWHTGIVVYGYEYFYGGGIVYSRPGGSMAGNPVQIIDIGETSVPQDVFHEFLRSISGRYTQATYSLLNHNCNNFSSEAARFLTGKDIPSFITGLPEEALNTPMGQMFKPMIQQMETQMKGTILPGFDGSGQLMLPPAASSGRRLAEFLTPAGASAPAPTAPTAQAETKTPPATIAAVVNRANKPLLSTDTKAKSYEVLLKQASKKVEEKVALTTPEHEVLAKLVAALAESKDTYPAESQALFHRLITTWPEAQLFSVLGLYRLLAVKVPLTAGDAKTGEILARIVSLLPHEEKKSDAPLAAQLMTLCVLSNLLANPTVNNELVADERTTKVGCAALQNADKGVRMMGGALLYNASLLLNGKDSDAAIEAVSALAQASMKETDAEVCQRLLLALPHFVLDNPSMVQLLAAFEFDAEAISARFPPSGGAANEQIAVCLLEIKAMQAKL